MAAAHSKKEVEKSNLTLVTATTKSRSFTKSAQQQKQRGDKNVSRKNGQTSSFLQNDSTNKMYPENEELFKGSFAGVDPVNMSWKNETTNLLFVGGSLPKQRSEAIVAVKRGR